MWEITKIDGDSAFDVCLQNIDLSWIKTADPAEAIPEILGELVADCITNINPFCPIFRPEEENYTEIQPGIYQTDFRGATYRFKLNGES